MWGTIEFNDQIEVTIWMGFVPGHEAKEGEGLYTKALDLRFVGPQAGQCFFAIHCFLRYAHYIPRGVSLCR